MKKIISLCIAIMVLATTVMAQPKAKAKPVKKTITKTKTKVNSSPSTDDVKLDLEYEGDSPTSNYSYPFSKGDQLVYHVNAGGSEYDFIVTLNMYNKNGIDFNYEMTNANNTKGHVVITPQAKDESRNLVNYFSGGELNLKDASTVWLSYATFIDMPTKKTTLSFDGAEKIAMYRPENDEVKTVIRVKGQDHTINAFKMNSAADGTGDKTLWVHNSSANPLIMKMDLGWTIELKEIK